MLVWHSFSGSNKIHIIIIEAVQCYLKLIYITCFICNSVVYKNILFVAWSLNWKPVLLHLHLSQEVLQKLSAKPVTSSLTSFIPWREMTYQLSTCLSTFHLHFLVSYGFDPANRVPLWFSCWGKQTSKPLEVHFKLFNSPWQLLTSSLAEFPVTALWNIQPPHSLTVGCKNSPSFQ